MTSDLQPRYPVALYYDGACRLCAGEMRNLMTRNTEGKLRFTDCSPADFSAGPAPRAALMRQMHAQDADGTVFTGVAALRVAYDAVGLGAMSGLLGLPVIAPLAARAYPVLARHRYLLPRWLIAPVFEHVLQRAARRAARRATACTSGACDRTTGHRDAA